MNTKTFFSTPKGSNNWYHYIILPLTVVVLASLLSLPAFFFKTEKDTPLYYFQLLLISAFMAIMVFVALKWIHKRSGYTLINAQKIRWGRIFWAMGCFGAITFLFELLSWQLNPKFYKFSFNEATFYQYLIVSLVLIPFQAAGEELLMRGYFLQGISWATHRPWVAAIITSVLFGLLHFGNPELEAFGNVFILNYILMGLALAIMTLMDDGAELAIGVHIINNLYSAILVGYPSSALQTNTLFTLTNYQTILWTIVMLLSFAIFLLLAAKKYQWISFKSLFDKLDV